ncbi:hypothetical protein ACP70R_028276 [Stipagrostis hirtigluma subsp. patula]
MSEALPIPSQVVHPKMSEGSASPAPAALPDDDDLLREILLRLPPLPSSLPRASLVSKRWRRLVADPQFLRRFRARHHRTPPLLGFFFACHSGQLVFIPTLDPPDCIPPARFSLPQRLGQSLRLLGCRHGLALLIDYAQLEAVVWDPVTGRQHRVVFPPEFKIGVEHHYYNGAVLSSASDGNNLVLRPFKLVLVRAHIWSAVASACLYESESEKWGDISSAAVPSSSLFQSSVLIGNALCWLLSMSSGILEFNLDRQSLAVIRKPVDADCTDESCFQVLRMEGNGLGLAVLSKYSIQLWGRKADSDGVFRWVLQKTVELDKLLSPRPSINTWPVAIMGFDEDSNVIFLGTAVGYLMIQAESMQFTKFVESTVINFCYPYTGLYTAG